MRQLPLTFAIPTYRLRDVPQTVEAYDENFSTNGHIVKLMVFDDSSPATQNKYYSLFNLIYTLGELLVSSDDDMRPYALMEDSPESLSKNEISRGKQIKPDAAGYSDKAFDSAQTND